MPRHAGPNDTQISIRLPVSALDRAEALAENNGIGAPYGVHATRADALRVALLRGLTELEEDSLKRETKMKPKKTVSR